MTGLHPRHLEDLRRSGLTDETIRMAGIYTVPPSGLGRKLGGGDAGVVSAYAIPYPGESFERYRLFYEEGRSGPKYRQAPGTPNHLYVPPGTDLAGTGPLVVTEGEKKALALWQAGFQAVALGGVWNWLERGKGYRPGGGRPVADLDRVAWTGRPTIILFDSDAHVNRLVRLAAFRLARELSRRGARVSVLFLPPGPGGGKIGADDYLVAHGPEALRALLETAWPFDPAWTDPEAEVWFQIRGLGPDTPASEKLKRLAALVPVLARLSQTEAAALLEDLKACFKLRVADLAALKGDLKRTRRELEAKKGGREKSLNLEALQEEARLHPAVDFPGEAMSLGFRVDLPEGGVGLLVVVSDGRGVWALVNPEAVQIGGQTYRLAPNSAPPYLRDVWGLDRVKAFLEQPDPPRDLYSRLKAALREYLDVPEPAYGLLAAWAVGTYLTPLFCVYPFLHFFGPKETGKSKALEALRHLCLNAWKGRDITAAALGDSVDGQRGTVLIDQAERLEESLVGLLSDSYKKAGGRRRVMEITKAGRTPLEFCTFGPKAFASTRLLDDDLTDRCVRISMTRTRRRLPDLEGYEPVWARLRDACYRFALWGFGAVRRAYEATPGDGTRITELWRPLAAVLKVLDVAPEEVAVVRDFYLEAVDETKHEPSPWEAALLVALQEKSRFADGPFTMSAKEIVDGMMIEGERQPSAKWVGQTIAKYHLAPKPRRQWVEGRYIRVYAFEPERVLKICEIYFREPLQESGSFGSDGVTAGNHNGFGEPDKKAEPVQNGSSRFEPNRTGSNKTTGSLNLEEFQDLEGGEPNEPDISGGVQQKIFDIWEGGEL